MSRFFANLNRWNSIRACATLGLLISATVGRTVAEDVPWSQFRGPRGNGVVEVSLPTDLVEPSNRVWSKETPGSGWSSPVVANGQIWLTAAVTKQATAEQIAAKLADVQLAQIKTIAAEVEFHAICMDTESGQVRMDTVLASVSDPDPINPMNSYASPTCAIAGDRVICHFGNYGTWCFDTRSFRQLWVAKLVVDHSVGPGSSPVIVDDKVLVVCDGVDKQFVAALNLVDGSEAWRTERPPIRATNIEFKKAYCTPLVITVAGKKMAVIPCAQWTVAYDPATGGEIWRADCGSGFSTTPMCIYENGLVVMSTGYTRPELVAIRPDGVGDVTATHMVWRTARGAPTMPSPVAQNGRLFTITDSGILSVFDISNGDEIHRVRIGGNFSASPILASGHLYLSSREGIVTVVKADEKLTLVSSNDLGSPIYASPGVVGKDMLVRTEKSIMRITSH